MEAFIVIITQNQPGVAHLVISRTDKKNALTRDMYQALAEGVSKAAADTSNSQGKRYKS